MIKLRDEGHIWRSCRAPDASAAAGAQPDEEYEKVDDTCYLFDRDGGWV